jgi:hypothetical protein
MVEDAPTSAKHGRRSRVMGMVQGMVLVEVLTEEFIERQLDEINALRQGGRTVPDCETRFWKLLRYAPHLNMKKLWRSTSS